jgi:tRNA-splicing ligase RtcB
MRQSAAEDGTFLTAANDYEQIKTCQILDCPVRVWGSENGRGLSRELVMALRKIVQWFEPRHPIALMADHHPAEFGVVGSVVVSDQYVGPDLIGGDCGCGVTALRLEVDRRMLSQSKLRSLFRMILERVPVGRAQNRELADETHALPLWNRLREVCFLSPKNQRQLRYQFATLGGGNHFIEVDYDEDGRLWIVVHSGSRFLGGMLKENYLNRRLSLSSYEAAEFFRVQNSVLEFAALSRRAMAQLVLAAVAELLAIKCPTIAEEIDLPHNYIALEEHQGQMLAVHRKGACQAAFGRTGIIPGSMASGSYIVDGRGGALSYGSCSHGAGRSYSRSRAIRELSTAELFTQMREVIWAESDRLKDESPGAYKDLESVIRAQRDLVKVRQRLRPLVVVKGLSR